MPHPPPPREGAEERFLYDLLCGRTVAQEHSGKPAEALVVLVEKP
jgi:hypothetical protein